MTDPSITRADARHEERITRENRRQALNHAVRLSNGLDPDSTLEAATRFARFLDGEGRRDAGTDAAEPVAGDDFYVVTGPGTHVKYDAPRQAVSSDYAIPASLIRSAYQDSPPGMHTLALLARDWLDSEGTKVARARREAFEAALEAWATANHPPSPVTEQHGATERPIRASVHPVRRDIVRLTPEGEASCFRSVIVVVPVDCAHLTGPDLATRIADLINGDA